MRIRHSFVIAVGLAATLATGAAHADMLPTHGFKVHLNPFIPGWPVPPKVPKPGLGVVKHGAEYDVLGPVSKDVYFGTDNYVGGEWHWENEYDLDPYLDQGPASSVFFDFRRFGGPLIGPFLVPLVAGPDIYIDTDQPDQNGPIAACTIAGGGPHNETGRFCKALINLTDIPIGWGTSVTEDPPDTPVKLEKTIRFFGDSGFSLTIPENTDGFNNWELANFPGGLVFRQVQLSEPGSFGLLAMGLGVLVLALRRTRRLPKT